MSPPPGLSSEDARALGRPIRGDASVVGAFGTRHRDRDQKQFAVLTTAAELFLTQGYRQTRLDDIAERLRITKPALYNYFRSKQDILFGCHMLGHDTVDEGLENIEAEGGDGASRLSQLIRVYAGVMTEQFGMCLIRLDINELPAAAQRRIRERRRAVNERFEHYLKMGIADGTLAKCDPKVTSFVIAGALNWISHWYRPQGGLSSAQIGEQFVQILVRREPEQSTQRTVRSKPKRTYDGRGGAG
jgi:AcrR family transcriptional regulator